MNGLNQDSESHNLETESGSKPKTYHRSVSQLKMYRTCPLQWKRVKFDKVPRQPAAWLAHGNAFHSVYEDWENLRRPEWDSEEILIRYQTWYDIYIEEMKEDQPDLDKWLTVGRVRILNDIAGRREKGALQLNVALARFRDEKWVPYTLPDGSLALETGFSMMIGNTPIQGKIDVIREWPNGVIDVADLKTGKREKTAIQLGVYRQVLDKVFGIDVDYGYWYYAKDDTWSDAINLANFSEEYLIEQFTAFDDGVKNRVFFASPGEHCQLCPAKAGCPEYI